MTGYGKASGAGETKTITVEIKTLNSKQADVSLRLPNAYSRKEMALRSLLASRLKRGKIYCQINIENRGAEPPVSINKELAVRYIDELNEISRLAGVGQSPDLIAIAARLPEVIVNKEEDVSKEEFETVKNIVGKALDDVDVFRADEGEHLAGDFRTRIKSILHLLESIKPYEESRLEKIRERLTAEMSKFSEKINVDENRFEQELIFYLEKLDITEEKIRLAKHCNYFAATLEEDGEEKGKKLGFVLQEIGREINTIGSKANDASIQKIVVQMKDELEKIKEQMMNIL